MESQSNSQATLGQRIDALIEPLNAQADQHRAALQQARTQIQQVKQQIDHSEQALREIEQQMVTVLHALAVEEPMLAKAMGTPHPTGFAPGISPAGLPAPVPHVPTPAEDAVSVAEIAGILDDIEAGGQAPESAHFPTAPTADRAKEQLSPEDAQARDQMLAIIDTGSLPPADGGAAAPSPSLEAAVQHAADVALELEQPPAAPAE